MATFRTVLMLLVLERRGRRAIFRVLGLMCFGALCCDQLIVGVALPQLAARSDKFAVVKTMHHTAGREFRNEYNSCTYLLHTGRTEMPVGDTNASIVNSRQGRFEWPSIGSLLAYANPPEPGVALPAVIEIPRTSLMR